MHRLFTKGNQCRDHILLNSENYASGVHEKTLPSIQKIQHTKSAVTWRS
jgi:hypothetical protein